MTGDQSQKPDQKDVLVPIAKGLIDLYRDRCGERELISKLKELLMNAYNMDPVDDTPADLPLGHLHVNNAVLINACPYRELVEKTPLLCQAHQELLTELAETNYELDQCIAEGDDTCIFSPAKKCL